MEPIFLLIFFHGAFAIMKLGFIFALPNTEKQFKNADLNQ